MHCGVVRLTNVHAKRQKTVMGCHGVYITRAGPSGLVTFWILSSVADNEFGQHLVEGSTGVKCTATMPCNSLIIKIDLTVSMLFA